MDETIEIFTAGEDLNRASPELWPELMPGVERYKLFLESLNLDHRIKDD